ncbi:hypothetical protein E2C01_098467 [Portunus trituberculatus]|uniref:Uncharacterized protein n=1 Tax=Portunus trituberculatus TaxID=210409 RepID=A0A5B7K197_PORTR|nr:hypothetical protein [Portunus trituberculatus]
MKILENSDNEHYNHKKQSSKGIETLDNMKHGVECFAPSYPGSLRVSRASSSIAGVRVRQSAPSDTPHHPHTPLPRQPSHAWLNLIDPADTSLLSTG